MNASSKPEFKTPLFSDFAKQNKTKSDIVEEHSYRVHFEQSCVQNRKLEEKLRKTEREVLIMQKKQEDLEMRYLEKSEASAEDKVMTNIMADAALKMMKIAALYSDLFHNAQNRASYLFDCMKVDDCHRFEKVESEFEKYLTKKEEERAMLQIELANIELVFDKARTDKIPLNNVKNMFEKFS